MTTLAERLRALRLERGLLQNELAEAVGRSQASIARWERGEREPSLDTLPKLGEVLGITVDDLLRLKMGERELVQ